MSHVQERYSPLVVAANSTVTLRSATSIAGFLAKTAGTVTVVDGRGVTVVDAHPVTAGNYYKMPFYLQLAGGTITTAGGASGTAAVW